MFNKPTVTEPTELDNAISRLYDFLESAHPGSEEYEKIADQLVKLTKLKDDNRPDKLSADAKATIISNLAGIALILNFERAGVVTSKALSFVTKLR